MARFMNNIRWPAVFTISAGIGTLTYTFMRVGVNHFSNPNPLTVATAVMGSLFLIGWGMYDVTSAEPTRQESNPVGTNSNQQRLGDGAPMQALR